MDNTPPQQTMLGYALIIGIAAIVITLRMRRMSKERPLKIEQLWIVPGIYGLIAGFLYWRFPPHGMTILWCAIAMALGAAAGWQRGRMMHISVDPETHAIRQKASPAAMLFLLALIAVRYGARELAATDILIAFALGLLSMQRYEMYLRAKRLLGEARAK